MRLKPLVRDSARAFLAVTGLQRPLRRYLPALLDGQQDALLWDLFAKLPPDKMNEHCHAVMKHCLGDQRFLLYSWPVQQQYARFLSEFLPGAKDVRVLELGPGDSLMTAALWMLDARVASVTMLDKFKGLYVESAGYHRELHDFARLVALAPRDGFYNFYPLDTPLIDRLESAIRIVGDAVRLDPALLRYVLSPDFTRFPLDDGAFDFVYSHATLEHFTHPAESIREMHRVLAPGGLMAHQIDLRDHRHFDEDPYRFLETPSAEWKFGGLAYPVNQWRANQYRDAMRSAGFDIVRECKVLRDPPKAAGVRFAPEFAAMDEGDRLITQIVFIARKPDR